MYKRNRHLSSFTQVWTATNGPARRTASCASRCMDQKSANMYVKWWYLRCRQRGLNCASYITLNWITGITCLRLHLPIMVLTRFRAILHHEWISRRVSRKLCRFDFADVPYWWCVPQLTSQVFCSTAHRYGLGSLWEVSSDKVEGLRCFLCRDINVFVPCAAADVDTKVLGRGTSLSVREMSSYRLDKQQMKAQIVAIIPEKNSKLSQMHLIWVLLHLSHVPLIFVDFIDAVTSTALHRITYREIHNECVFPVMPKMKYDCNQCCHMIFWIQPRFRK